MKKMELLIFIVILGTCGFGFGLPFLFTGSSAQKVYDSDLLIPNTGGGTATATRSTERALTIQAVSTLFNTATNTSVSEDILAPTNTLGATSTLSLESLPSVTLTSLTIEPTITRRPRERPTRTAFPPTQTLALPTNTRLPLPTSTKLPTPTRTKLPTPTSETTYP